MMSGCYIRYFNHKICHDITNFIQTFAKKKLFTGKVREHICQNILSSDSEVTPDQIQLSCNKQVLDTEMDLRTVQHFISSSTSDELVLSYKILKHVD